MFGRAATLGIGPHSSYLCSVSLDLLCVSRLFLPVLDFCFLSTSQEIGWEQHLRNNLFCVEWDVNLNSVGVVVDRCGTTIGLRQRTYNSSNVTGWQVAAVNTAVVDVCDCLLTRFIQLPQSLTLMMGRR